MPRDLTAQDTLKIEKVLLRKIIKIQYKLCSLDSRISYLETGEDWVKLDEELNPMKSTEILELLDD